MLPGRVRGPSPPVLQPANDGQRDSSYCQTGLQEHEPGARITYVVGRSVKGRDENPGRREQQDTCRPDQIGLPEWLQACRGRVFPADDDQEARCADKHEYIEDDVNDWHNIPAEETRPASRHRRSFASLVLRAIKIIRTRWSSLPGLSLSWLNSNLYAQLAGDPDVRVRAGCGFCRSRCASVCASVHRLRRPLNCAVQAERPLWQERADAIHKRRLARSEIISPVLAPSGYDRGIVSLLGPMSVRPPRQFPG